MRTRLSTIPTLAAALFTTAATLLTGCASAPKMCQGCVPVPGTLLCNPSHTTLATINDRRGGRVTSFTPYGHTNLLWECPADADPNLYGWANFGGEKTWIGPQPLWKELSPPGWPPPLFFDTASYSILDATDSSSTLLSALDPAWGTQIQRTVALTNHVLYITSSLTQPNPDHLLWSVVQIPFAQRVAARLTGPKRILNGSEQSDAPLPSPTPVPNSNLIAFDLPAPTPNGKCILDADLLAVQFPDGTLVIKHHSPNPDFGPTPYRAHLYRGLHVGTSPEQGGAYLELEFLSPSTSPHTISLHFLPHTLCTNSAALEAIP